MLFIPVLLFSQVTTTEFGNISTDIGLDLSYIKRELSMPYKSNRINIAGNKYFFKEPSNATLVLIEDQTPVNVITNYNLLEQTFDIFDGSETLKLLPNKIKKRIISSSLIRINLVEISPSSFKKSTCCLHLNRERVFNFLKTFWFV